MWKARLKADNVPLKWKKYLLLVDYDLVSAERLHKEVRRYGSGERNQVIADVEKLLSEQQESGALIVVKAVNPRAAGQLPNYRIQSWKDLTCLVDFLDAVSTPEYTEVWFCATAVDRGRRSAAGRMLFADDPLASHTVEHLSRCSPRLLEQVRLGRLDEFAWPYFRASRPNWGWRYRLEYCHRPLTWPESPAELVDGLHATLHLIEEARDRVAFFCERVLEAGIDCLSLEYKVLDSELWFVDWDTPNDISVVKRLYG